MLETWLSISRLRQIEFQIVYGMFIFVRMHKYMFFFFNMVYTIKCNHPIKGLNNVAYKANIKPIL